MGKLFAAVPIKQVSDRVDYNRWKNAAEPGEGKLGVTPMTAQQIRDRKARDSAKTPMNQQVYS